MAWANTIRFKIESFQGNFNTGAVKIYVRAIENNLLMEISKATFLLLWEQAALSGSQSMTGAAADFVGLPRGTINPAYITAPIVPPNTGKVIGRVSSLIGGIGFATVSFYGQTVTTDPNGYYEIEIDQGISGQIEVSAQGYDNFQDMISVGDGQTLTKNFTLSQIAPPINTNIKHYDLIFNMNFNIENSQIEKLDPLFARVGGIVGSVSNCELKSIYARENEIHILIDCNPIGLIIGSIVAVVLFIFGWLGIREWKLISTSDNQTIQDITALQSEKLSAVKEAYSKGVLTDDEYKAMLGDIEAPDVPNGSGAGIMAGAGGLIIAGVLIMALTKK